MPYFIGHTIHENLKPMWGENVVYSKKNLHSVKSTSGAPVNYDSHSINPHSLTHLEFPKHTIYDGDASESYVNKKNIFFGNCLVVKLKGNHFKKVEGQDDLFWWEVTKRQLVEAIGGRRVTRVLVTVENYPENEDGFHDPNYVLTLSEEAASLLVESDTFCLYGTSWKSTDFNSGKDRPIHNMIFSKGLILECLDLKDVPDGEYFIVVSPVFMEGASEVPVNPVLFELDEVNFTI